MKFSVYYLWFIGRVFFTTNCNITNSQTPNSEPSKSHLRVIVQQLYQTWTTFSFHFEQGITKQSFQISSNPVSTSKHCTIYNFLNPKIFHWRNGINKLCVFKVVQVENFHHTTQYNFCITVKQLKIDEQCNNLFRTISTPGQHQLVI